jgi:hypothetical protein
MGAAVKTNKSDRRFRTGVSTGATHHHRSGPVVVDAKRYQLAPTFGTDEVIAATEFRFWTLMSAGEMMQIRLLGEV